MSTIIPVTGDGFQPYDVVIGQGLLPDLGRRIAALAKHRTVIVTDETVAALHGPAVLAALEAAGVRARLLTVPPGETSKSFAELERVIDRLLICDAAFFDWLADEGAAGAGGDAAALTRAVVRSVEIKSAIVGEDEKEAGRRALLNLGHTFGHAIEAELGFDEMKITHGEAVALGCAMAFRFSAASGLCEGGVADRVAQVISAAGLPARLADAGAFCTDALVDRMAGDKKAEGGRLTLILARAIGDAFVDKAVDRGTLAAFLKTEGAS